MEIIFITFIVALGFLLWSGKILPRALEGIAQLLGISQFIAAFLLASFATSLPELFIGISSAFQGITDLALGAVIGSNVVNLTVVIGISVIIAGNVNVDSKISRQNYWLIFIIAFLPLLLIADGTLSRFDGLILLVSFGLYAAKLIRDKEHFQKQVNNGKKLRGKTLVKKTIFFSTQFVFGVALLLVSSFALVWASKAIVVEYFSSNFALFGFIVVALGTSLPELVFGARAVMSGRSGAMLGNALGSIAFNAAAIIGIVALIRPISVDFNRDFIIASVFLFLAFALFHFFLYTKNRLSWKEGAMLVLLYILFLVIAIPRCIECFLFP